MYLEKVRQSGMKMVVYERYVDDSNQVARVPSPESLYDADRKKVVQNPNLVDTRNDDQRLAENLKQIANAWDNCYGRRHTK